MGIRSYVKNTFKANTNVKGWSGWDLLKSNAKVVKDFADDLKASNVDTSPVSLGFEEAMKKYGLTENDVMKQKRIHLIAALFSFVLALAALLWTLHLFFMKGMFLSSLVSLSLAVLMGSYGFREHFFYFQMKQRKLNCTVSEWVSSFFSGKRV